MDFDKVSAEIRNETGKGNARRSRAAGKAPGILYGHNEPPVALTVDPLLLVKSQDKERKRNTVFSLTVGEQTVTVMVRDVQIDPLSRRILHVDFIRVSMDEEVKVMVPLVLTGTPVGVTDGGNLHHGLHMLPIAAKPAEIPAKVEVDVTALKINEALHVSDLKLAGNFRVLLDPKESLASVVAPRAEKDLPTAAAVAVDGAAAAPADGAAAAPAAAGDKAAGGDKKAVGGDEGKKKGK